MRVLVTGGAGYIGSFMVQGLLDNGNEVMVVDSLEKGRKEAVASKAEFLVGDLRDKDFIGKLFSDHNFDAVVHFAGYISMEESTVNPYIYLDNNINSSLNILENMVRNKINNFIFSSTAGIYGNPLQIPIREDHPKNPTNPYGESKLTVERILGWYNKIHGLNFVSLRYFNAAGASLKAELGENHLPETHIIPSAISAVLENKEFILYGDDYKTPDGTCIRDYIHVLDLVGSHILALEKLGKEKGGFFYNVGTGRGYSNREIIDMVIKVSSKNLRVKVSQRRSGDAEKLIADPTKIKNELGFSPKYSDLETIIKTAWEWHKKILNFKFKV